MHRAADWAGGHMVVLHLGGVLQDCSVPRQSSLTMRRVGAPKLAGALGVVRGVGHCPVHQEVLFSSVAALLQVEAAGQANYAAANGGLDSLAAEKSAQGMVVCSIQWGPWSGGGMASANAALHRKLERGKVYFLSEASGLCTLRRIVATATQIGPRPVTWGAAVVDWRYRAETDSAWAALLQELVPRRQLPEAAAPVRIAAERLRSPVGTGEDVEAKIQAAISHVLGSTVSSTDPLVDAGLDSLSAGEVRESIASTFGMEMPATLVFDYPTVQSMTAYVRGCLGAPTAAEPAMRAPAATTRAPRTAVVAALGMADSAELAAGTDRIRCVPSSRWRRDGRGLPGERVASLLGFGGFLRDIHHTDSEALGLAPSEATQMDPQQRLLLAEARNVLEPRGQLTEEAR
eukprot:5141504-Ditylum_brightwellii.AAC.1